MQQKDLYDLPSLITFRRDLHKYAELAFQETRTSSKIIEYLASIGIATTQIQHVAKTGLIVDISGQGPPSNQPYCIALRADMDGLPIKENNPDIDFQSMTEVSHTCGHDIHMTCLIGGAAKILEKIEQILIDKKIRLLFQPAEEKLGGAKKMVKEGALIGVDEVYGFHNCPFEKPGALYTKKGYMMPSATFINITITGKGGHSSIIDQLKDPLQPAIDIHVGLRELVKEYKEKRHDFTINLPMIKGSNAGNVIPDTCIIQGGLRAFDTEFTNEFKDRFEKLVLESCSRYGCTANIEMTCRSPPIFNADKETENVIRVGKKLLGEDNVKSERLPLHTCEDFAFLSQAVPGTFFLLTAQNKETDVQHTDHYNPSEGVIPIGCEMWYRLVEDRFGLTFI